MPVATMPVAEELETQRQVLALFLAGEPRHTTAEIKSRLDSTPAHDIEAALVELVFAGILSHERDATMRLRPCVPHLTTLGLLLDTADAGLAADILTEVLEDHEGTFPPLLARVETIRDRLRWSTPSTLDDATGQSRC